MYAAVSLDKRVGEETITLPVALEFPPRYLSPETDALIRYTQPAVMFVTDEFVITYILQIY